MISKPIVLAAGLALLLLADAAFAQSRGIGRPGSRPGRFSSGYSAPSVNPMANIMNRPTVSPYLNLLNGGPGNYQSFVRPFAQNQQQLRQQQNQIGGLQRGLNQVQQSLQAPTSGDGSLRPTGHTSQYMNYSHYYPRKY